MKLKIIAFTLAEVLITLGIIGIVAAMTIPTLIGNADKQKIVSQVKEDYSILAQATNQINNDCGGDVVSCVTSPPVTRSEKEQVATLYKEKLSISKDCNDGATTGCFANTTYTRLNNNSFYNIETYTNWTNSRLGLANGAAVAFQWFGATGYPPYYFEAAIDINGPKAPNQVGKDYFIFVYDINKKALVPEPSVSTCVAGGMGNGCATKILQENDITYY